MQQSFQEQNENNSKTQRPSLHKFVGVFHVCY